MTPDLGSSIKINVQKGETAWKLAANLLAKEGKKPSNQEIAKEMDRLAKLNGCKSVDEFGKKFISGKTISMNTADKNEVKSEVKQKVSTSAEEGSIPIKSGDSPWKIAANNLAKEGKKPSSQDIVKEMNKLAQINGCKSVDEFGKKFSRIGESIKVPVNKQEATYKINNGLGDDKKSKMDSLLKISGVAPIDSTKVARSFFDSTKINNQVAKDSIKTPEKKSESWDVIQKKYEKINSLGNDEQKVIEWHKQNADKNTENYVIVDKKSCKLNVYSAKGDLLKTFESGLGKVKGDEVRRKLEGHHILASTSAGVYTIDYRGNGRDAYSGHYGKNIFQMTTDKGATGVAIHQIPNELPGRYGLLGNGNLEDNRMSNGCINLRKKDFEELAKLKVSEGSKVYILPEEDNNYISVKNGQLNLTQKVYDGKLLTSKVNSTINPIVIKPKKGNLSEMTDFTKALCEKKEDLSKKLHIDNDTYNDLAQLAVGIAGQETDFGRSSKYWVKENPYTAWTVSVGKFFSGNKSVNSRGLTQMKIDAYNDDVKKQLKDYGINSDNVNKPDKSALATVIALANMYKNELPSIKSIMNDKNISMQEALLYLWQGKKEEITNKTATPDKNLYIKNVMKYQKYFDVEQLQS